MSLRFVRTGDDGETWGTGSWRSNNQTRQSGSNILICIDIGNFGCLQQFAIWMSKKGKRHIWSEWFTSRRAGILHGWSKQTPVLSVRRKRTKPNTRDSDMCTRSGMQPCCKLHGRLLRLGSVATSEYNVSLRGIEGTRGIQDGAFIE